MKPASVPSQEPRGNWVPLPDPLPGEDSPGEDADHDGFAQVSQRTVQLV
jgi:hypothetical protein